MPKPVIVKTTTKPPEHDFTLKQADWELVVFDRANKFIAAGYRGRGTRRHEAYDTLPEAIAAAQGCDFLCTYAAAPTGRFICLDRADWPRWLARYNARAIPASA